MIATKITDVFGPEVGYCTDDAAVERLGRVAIRARLEVAP